MVKLAFSIDARRALTKTGFILPFDLSNASAAKLNDAVSAHSNCRLLAVSIQVFFRT